MNWKDASMKCFGMMLDGRAQKTGIKRRGEDKTVLIVMNSWEGPVGFTLPAAEASEHLVAAGRHQSARNRLGRGVQGRQRL